jgi:hypothetical protein
MHFLILVVVGPARGSGFGIRHRIDQRSGSAKVRFLCNGYYYAIDVFAFP